MCWNYILYPIIGIVIGIIAGYLSGGNLRGFLRYIFLGIIGASVGGYVFVIIDNNVLLVSIVGAVITAIILLIIAKLIELIKGDCIK